MKNTIDVNSAKADLLKELERVNNERKALQDRVEELRQQERNLNLGQFGAVKGFKIEDVEKDSSTADELRDKRSKIKAALNQDKYIDAGLRKAALKYIEAIEPEVKKLDDKRNAEANRIEELRKAYFNGRDDAEYKIRDISCETNDLISLLGISVFKLTGYTVSGGFCLNQLKNKLEEME